MTYYLMVDDEIENEVGEALFDIDNCFKVGNIRSWSGGRLISETIDEVVNIDFIPFRDFKGKMIDLWDVCLPLMSVRLAQVLVNSGVNNLQLFPSVLTNTETGEKHDYYIFNVVGTVSATNLEESELETYDGQLNCDTSILHLSIDERKARGLLLFRLRENINALIVHESVRDYAVAHGIPEQRFTKPEDWIQL